MALSNPEITRRGDVVPGDKQDQPADGVTDTVTFTDGTSINWGDALQHFMLRAADDLGRVGTLANRPTAGSDEPVWWLVTDGAAGPYWTYNDGSQWIVLDQFPDGVTAGEDATETITSASATLQFGASDTRDIHTQTDVVVSNPSGGAVTEDVTVTLYDGQDNGGTQLLTETKTSGSVSAGGTASLTFIATEQALDDGDYFVEVTFSGTTLEVDTLDELVEGAAYSLDDDVDGTGRLRDVRRAATVFDIDPTDGTVDVKGALQEAGTPVLSGSPTTASGSTALSSGTATVDTGVAVDNTTYWDVSLAPENGADVAASLEDDSGGTGNYLIHIEENTTNVGNPTVNWKLTEDVL